jgi:hypothetical protein
MRVPPLLLWWLLLSSCSYTRPASSAAVAAASSLTAVGGCPTPVLLPLCTVFPLSHRHQMVFSGTTAYMLIIISGVTIIFLVSCASAETLAWCLLLQTRSMKLCLALVKCGCWNSTVTCVAHASSLLRSTCSWLKTIPQSDPEMSTLIKRTACGLLRNSVRSSLVSLQLLRRHHRTTN